MARKIWIITLFPEYFNALLKMGVTSSALLGMRGHSFEVKLVQLRDYSDKSYKGVDDTPYGGGPGMVMRPDILKRALSEGVIQAGGYSESAADELGGMKKPLHVVCPGPKGPLWDNKMARKFAKTHLENEEGPDLVFICGRYEGIDERFINRYVDEEISVGNYVLSGGELAVSTILDSALRFVPGVLGNNMSAISDSFEDDGHMEAPQYTKPRDFEGMEVPEVLLSGNHALIDEYRKGPQKQSPKVDKKKRANLYVGLVHHPVNNKRGEIVTTSVTNLDIHDIARTCRTYGVAKYFIITPLQAQHQLVGRILNHWEQDKSFEYNPDRQDALGVVSLAECVEESISEIERIEGHRPLVVVTGANFPSFDGDTEHLKNKIELDNMSVLLLFGTGSGLNAALVDKAGYKLSPINCNIIDGYNHLSVRSAVAIYLDRLRGGL